MLAKFKAGQGMRMFSRVGTPGTCLLDHMPIMAMVDMGLLWKILGLFLVQAMNIMDLLRHLVMRCHLNMYGEPIFLEV